MGIHDINCMEFRRFSVKHMMITRLKMQHGCYILRGIRSHPLIILNTPISGPENHPQGFLRLLRSSWWILIIFLVYMGSHPKFAGQFQKLPDLCGSSIKNVIPDGCGEACWGHLGISQQEVMVASAPTWLQHGQSAYISLSFRPTLC